MAARTRTGGGKRKSLDMKIHRRRLPNRLLLMAMRTRRAPTVAITCGFEISQIHEPESKPGLVNLLGDALDEGTEEYSGNELAELVEGYGGFLHTGGSSVGVQMAAADVKVAVRILGQVVMHPAFPTAGVRRVKKLVTADILADQDEPRTVAGQCFKASVYGRHPFGRAVKGTIDSVSAITRSQLKSFHKKWFTPDNCVIAASGDVDPEEILDLLSKTFGSWKGKAPSVPDTDEPSEITKPLHRHLPYDRAQVQIYLGHLGVRRSDPDFYRLRVMDHILGSGPGFTSRIARKLRDEQGLCYAVGAGISGSAGLERGTFTAYIGTSPGQETRAIQGFLREMRAIRDEPPSEPELNVVKAYLTGSFVWGLERNANLASYLLRLERYELGDDYIERLPGLINAVTREGVSESARKHLHPDRYHLVTLGSIDKDSIARVVGS
ncbi:MAG: M16 family metallopeptidase [Planctomycetota bacterium]